MSDLQGVPGAHAAVLLQKAVHRLRQRRGCVRGDIRGSIRRNTRGRGGRREETKRRDEEDHLIGKRKKLFEFT